MRSIRSICLSALAAKTSTRGRCADRAAASVSRSASIEATLCAASTTTSGRRDMTWTRAGSTARRSPAAIASSGTVWPSASSHRAATTASDAFSAWCGPAIATEKVGSGLPGPARTAGSRTRTTPAAGVSPVGSATPRKRAEKSRPSSSSGACRRAAVARITRRAEACVAPLTTGTPRLMIPAFSAAIFAIELPRMAMWSRLMLVITVSSGRQRFVASSRPPRPVSSTATSTFARAKWRKATQVSSSNQVGPRVPRRAAARSSRSATGITVSKAAVSARASIGRPSISIRSSRAWTWGERYRPTRRPPALSMPAIMATVDPFPFVPATCTTGTCSCGDPTASSNRRIRDSANVPCPAATRS